MGADSGPRFLELAILRFELGDHLPVIGAAADARRRLENLQFAPHLVDGFVQLLAKGLFRTRHSAILTPDGGPRHAPRDQGAHADDRDLGVRYDGRGRETPRVGDEVRMEYRRYDAADLAAVVRLCAQENWPSFPEDPARAHRALTAPGVTTMIAVEDGVIAGFAQLISDGEIQAHLSLIAVDPAYRRRGVARELIVLALRAAGGLRIDLITNTAEDFYASFPHFRLAGFKLYPGYRGQRTAPDDGAEST